MDLASLKTRKVHLHSCEPFNWDHRSTDMRVSRRVFVVSNFIIIITYFFQGKEEESDMMIGMERATCLSSEEVTHNQLSGMIDTATAADDEEVQVIFRSMKSAISHFVGDKKYLSA